MIAINATEIETKRGHLNRSGHALAGGYRNFTHVFSTINSSLLNSLETLTCNFKWLPSRVALSFAYLDRPFLAHIFGTRYRNSIHIFTGIPYTKLVCVNQSRTERIQALTGGQRTPSQGDSADTGISITKVPGFQSCKYRNYTHTPTVIPYTNSLSLTGISVTKLISNLLTLKTNPNRKDELKDDLKKIIPFDVAPFFGKNLKVSVCG